MKIAQQKTNVPTKVQNIAKYKKITKMPKYFTDQP